MLLSSRKGSRGEARITEQTVDRARETFTRSPRKSVRRASHYVTMKLQTFLFQMVLSACILFNICENTVLQNTTIVYMHPVVHVSFNTSLTLPYYSFTPDTNLHISLALILHDSWEAPYTSCSESRCALRLRCVNLFASI
jgi:hypothetical protein